MMPLKKCTKFNSLSSLFAPTYLSTARVSSLHSSTHSLYTLLHSSLFSHYTLHPAPYIHIYIYIWNVCVCVCRSVKLLSGVWAWWPCASHASVVRGADVLSGGVRLLLHSRAAAALHSYHPFIASPSAAATVELTLFNFHKYICCQKAKKVNMLINKLPK